MTVIFCYLVTHRIPFQYEPAAAAVFMDPLFPVRPPGVFAHEQVVCPLLVGEGVRVGAAG